MFRTICCGCVLLLLECGVRNVDAEALAPSKPAIPSAAGALVDRHGDPLPPGAMARLGTERFRHGHDFVDAAFSADGKRVVSVGSWLSGVTVWDAATGKKLHHFVPESLSPLCVSPNGKLVVAEAKQGRFISILDAFTGKELHGFEGQLRGRWHNASAFSGDGKFFRSPTEIAAFACGIWCAARKCWRSRYPSEGR